MRRGEQSPREVQPYIGLFGKGAADGTPKEDLSSKGNPENVTAERKAALDVIAGNIASEVEADESLAWGVRLNQFAFFQKPDVNPDELAYVFSKLREKGLDVRHDSEAGGYFGYKMRDEDDGLEDEQLVA